MELFSIGLPAGTDTHDDVAEFSCEDVSAMLSHLEQSGRTDDTPVYRNGRPAARLLRLGGKSASYWMIMPA